MKKNFKLPIFVEIKVDDTGFFPCLICGDRVNSVGKAIPLKSFSTISNLYQHVSRTHSESEDYISYSFALLTYKTEQRNKLSSMSIEKRADFFGSTVYKRCLNLLGVKEKHDAELLISNLQGIFKIREKNTEETNVNSSEDVKIDPSKLNSNNDNLPTIKANSDSDIQNEDSKKTSPENKIKLLWNSLVLAFTSKKHQFSVFSKAGFTFSKYFLEQKDGEEYDTISKMLNVESQLLKELVLLFAAVDNNDVKLPYSFTRERYHAMMQRVIFVIPLLLLPKNIDLTNWLSGKWKTSLSSSQIPTITTQYCTISNSEELHCTSIIGQYVDGLLKEAIRKKSSRSFSIRKDDIVDEKSLLSNYKLFLQESGIISRQVLDRRCSTTLEFEEGFDSLKKEVPPNSGIIYLSDQPGHDGTRRSRPSCLVNLHKQKIALMSAVSAAWGIGFKEFQKYQFFNIKRDTRTIPHGYLKKIQFVFHNYSMCILIILMRTFCHEKGCNFSTFDTKQFVTLLWKKDSSFISDFFVKVKWENLSELFCDVLFVPLIFKKSLREKNWTDFCVSRKLMLRLLHRTNHNKYFKGILEEFLDFDHIWSKDLLQVYKSLFVLQTVWKTYSTYDEFYELQKAGTSSNPVSSLLRNSKLGNIIRFVKFVESDGEINFGQQQLLKNSDLVILSKKFEDEIISKKLYQNIRYASSIKIQSIPSNSKILGQDTRGNVYFLPPKFSGIFDWGIKRWSNQSELDIKEKVETIIKNNF